MERILSLSLRHMDNDCWQLKRRKEYPDWGNLRKRPTLRSEIVTDN